MKNLKNHVLNLENPDDIIGVTLEVEKLERYQDRWGGHSPIYPIDNIWPGERATRIIEKNIGKQFSKAFSHFCNQVPVYQQNEFLDEFRDNLGWYGPDYYIDVNGNIQKTKRKTEKPKVIFYSDDYKFEKRHKITNRLYTSYYWGDWKKLKLKDEDFHNVVVSGYAKEFSSRNDPEYQRLTQEKKKERRRKLRIERKEKKLLESTFLIKSDEDYFRQREENKLKILRHGFDYDISFRRRPQMAE
jgi:hypothetical protein